MAAAAALVPGPVMPSVVVGAAEATMGSIVVAAALARADVAAALSSLMRDA